MFDSFQPRILKDDHITSLQELLLEKSDLPSISSQYHSSNSFRLFFLTLQGVHSRFKQAFFIDITKDFLGSSLIMINPFHSFPGILLREPISLRIRFNDFLTDILPRAFHEFLQRFF